MRRAFRLKELSQTSLAIVADVGLLTGYSAHADQAGLVQWAFPQWNNVVSAVGHTVFLQHGNDDQRAALADALKTMAERTGSHVNVICPREDSVWLDLERGAEEVNQEVENEKIRSQIRQLEAQIRNRRTQAQ